MVITHNHWIKNLESFCLNQLYTIIERTLATSGGIECTVNTCLLSRGEARGMRILTFEGHWNDRYPLSITIQKNIYIIWWTTLYIFIEILIAKCVLNEERKFCLWEFCMRVVQDFQLLWPHKVELSCIFFFLGGGMVLKESLCIKGKRWKSCMVAMVNSC